MAVYAGKLNERVTIQTPRETRTTLGESYLSWDDLATVWARVEGMNSREVLQAMQANAVVSHKIHIRYREGVNHEARVIWRGRHMEIASVVERQNRTMLELLVREVT